MVKYRRILTLLIVVALCWSIFHRSGKAYFFLPFDEGQIQEHHTQKERVNFYYKLNRKKWRLLNKLYKSQLAGKRKRQKIERIPKIIHQIWLNGPLPEKYKHLQQTWIAYHPGWEYHLWTEEEIKYLYLQNRPLFDEAPPEKRSDVLRYEILYQFGGLFIDVDFECLKPFDILHENCDFYAGTTDQTRTPQICSSLIAAVPGHPVIKQCIRKLRDNSLIELDSNYLTRCFFETVKKKTPHSCVILPAIYFYPSSEDIYSFAFPNH